MQCPDCGAYYDEKDEFCGECGLRLSPETSSEPEKAEVEASPPELGETLDLVGDLVEPSLPEPPPVKPKPKEANLLPVVIAVGATLLLLCLAATGAIIWFFLQEGPAATPTVTSIMPEPGTLLYQEIFEDPYSGWSEFADDEASTVYEDGGYQITVNESNYMAWGSPEPALDFADMIVDVDVRQVEGPLDNLFGLLIRYREDDEQYSYYWFQISGDGFYSIDLQWQDEWIPLVGWEPSAAIYTGLGVTNRIRVVCSGGQFSFYSNDVHLVDLFDDTLGRGSIGLAAGALEEPGVVVRFDNLKVYEVGE